MGNLQFIGYLILAFLILLFIGWGIGMTIAAVIHCGWSSLFFGKNVFWAYVFGMCP